MNTIADIPFPNPPAVVIGLCKHGLYLTRNFTRHGVPVYVLERDLEQPSARTRYGHKIFCANLEGDSLVQKLMELRRVLPRYTPLFPTNDRIIDLLLRHYGVLSEYYSFPFPAGDIVTRLKDKEILQIAAEEAGLNVPRSYIVRHEADLNKISSDLKFPVAVKPSLPMMSFKSSKCNDLQSLKDQVVKSEKLVEPLIVQEWIDGDDRQILFAAYYIGQDGRCLARYSGRKLVCYPPLTGHAAATEGWNIEHLVDEGYSFLRRAGYWGLCSIEYKGELSAAKFIEVTVGRCDWWIMACGINGVNIPMAAYNDLLGTKVPFDNQQQDRFIWHDIECSIPVLLENLLTKRWGPRELVDYLRRPKYEALFDKSDLMPFLYFLKLVPYRILQAIGRRARRLVK